ncbi:uncharacterized protein DUF4375 [Rhizobium sp. PP-F2F-G38]|nr:uncharacterized protein DUF4375 [Rhizobium sp. PP-F2F-G38]
MNRRSFLMGITMSLAVGRGQPTSGSTMTTTYGDLGSLDDWLLRQAMEQAEQGISIEGQLIPQVVVRLGQPCEYLYATVIFDNEVANGGLRQFFDNSSGALAPTVLVALQEMLLPEYADIMRPIIDEFGEQFPRDQIDRMDKISNSPKLQNMLDRSSDTIDVWSRRYVSARQAYASKYGLLR